MQTINQLNFLIITCFSFAILIMSFMLTRGKKTMTRVLGGAFIIPLVLMIYAFLNAERVRSFSVFALSEFFLVMVLFLIVIAIHRTIKMRALQIGVFLFPLVVIALLSAGLIDSFWTGSEYLVYIILIAFVPSSYLLFTGTSRRRRSYLAATLLPIASVIQSLGDASQLAVAALLIRAVAYPLFIAQLFDDAHQVITYKVREAEKTLASYERNVQLEVKKRTFHIEMTNQRLSDIAKTDQLTQAYNKATILDVMDRLVNKRIAEFSILIFDIDDFKRINDQLGHVVGDKVLKTLAGHARKSIRENIDSLGRYGGDEFIIVLPNTVVSDAVVIAERFRKLVDASRDPHFSVSVGIAYYPDDANTVKGLIAYADEGLYKSKRKGKNAVSHKSMY
ncbi:MAG: diguanylate cyclase [Solirubrobacterales bacterium]